MADDPVPDRFASVIGGIGRASEGEEARRAQELSHADQTVLRTHVAVCQAVAEAAGELRRLGVPTDTGRFSPTGRGWRLPSMDLWISWDGSAYITGEIRAGAARKFRFDARRQPPTLFELPSWTTKEGGVRHRVLLRGDDLVVSPSALSFVDLLATAVSERADRN
jgi:hypothetical protein